MATLDYRHVTLKISIEVLKRRDNALINHVEDGIEDLEEDPTKI